LLRAWNGARSESGVHAVVERDDGYVGVADVSEAFAAPTAWAPTERAVLDRAEGSVLDIGCGGGRHAVALHAAGHPVVAVDISPGAVEVARGRGVDARLGSAGALGAVGSGFATIVLAGQNIGLLGSRQQAGRVLASIAAVAAPNAVILGTGIDPRRMPAEHAVYHRANPHRGRLFGQHRIRIRHRGLATAWFDYLFVSPDELDELLAGTPWRLEDIVDHGMDYLAQLRRRP
jgi:SAM-dependent methyltransferase